MALFIVCGAGAALCLTMIVFHLRVVRRLENLAYAVDRAILPYLRRRAAHLRVATTSRDPRSSPDAIITSACSLASQLLEIEQVIDHDVALASTQNLVELPDPAGDTSHPPK
jgi:hypothetical protein